MNLEEEILREHSRRQAERIATWVGRDRQRFRRLMHLFLNGEYVITQRLAWVVGICADVHPELVRPYLRRLMDKMQQPGVHDAVKRNIVRMLQCIDIPSDLLGVVATLCFEYLSQPDTPIAVKCSAMTVLARLAQKEPDLGRELRLVVEQQLPFSGAAFRARARKILIHTNHNNQDISHE